MIKLIPKAIDGSYGLLLDCSKVYCPPTWSKV